MDRPSFLLISIIGLLSMVTLHLVETWLAGYGAALKPFLLEWLPLYLIWMSMILIGLFKRASNPSRNRKTQ